jgi:hypothetical protein
MGRHNGRATCEMCQWIDVRRWHREGRLRPGLSFPYSWSLDGKPFGAIQVRIKSSAAVLSFRTRTSDDDEWRSVEQRIPIEWTQCKLGGARPWFRCAATSKGRYCGSRRAVLFLGGQAGFACRCCYQLGYASQLEPLRLRGLAKARKIRMRLGGDANVLNEFPAKPKGMHQRTYTRLRRLYDIAAARCGAVASATSIFAMALMLEAEPSPGSRFTRLG